MVRVYRQNSLSLTFEAVHVEYKNKYAQRRNKNDMLQSVEEDIVNDLEQSRLNSLVVWNVDVSAVSERLYRTEAAVGVQ